jgi:hypothetical protein
VNLFLPIRRGPRLPRPLAAVAGCAALCLILRPLRAEAPFALAQHAAGTGLGQCRGISPPAGSWARIDDVMLRPDGVLRGRVICPQDGDHSTPGAGLPVALLRAAETVARTVTGAEGRFAFGDLRGGLYRVVVRTAEGPRWRFCRLWTADAAPPYASGRMTVLVGRGRIRGQSPGPLGRLPRGATVAAIAVGAIVPPIIYYGYKRDEHVPASPLRVTTAQTEWCSPKSGERIGRPPATETEVDLRLGFLIFTAPRFGGSSRRVSSARHIDRRLGR